MGKGLDAFSDLTSKASELVSQGYTFVARYYFKSSAFKHLLTKPEAQALSEVGLYIISVYENGQPTTDAYWTVERAQMDAKVALQCAENSGQPKGTPIYFTVDYDASPSIVVQYFKELHSLITPNGYTVGVYGSGVVCERLLNLGYVSHTWLSQSKGFPGWEEFKTKANIVQGPVTKVLGLDTDLDTSNGNAGGWKIA